MPSRVRNKSKLVFVQATGNGGLLSLYGPAVGITLGQSMNIQERVITRVATRVGADEFKVEPSALYRHLLLFNACILRTLRFTEIAHLARTSGFKSVKALLESGAVQFHWNWLTIAGNITSRFASTALRFRQRTPRITPRLYSRLSRAIPARMADKRAT